MYSDVRQEAGVTVGTERATTYWWAGPRTDSGAPFQNAWTFSLVVWRTPTAPISRTLRNTPWPNSPSEPQSGQKVVDLGGHSGWHLALSLINLLPRSIIIAKFGRGNDVLWSTSVNSGRGRPVEAAVTDVMSGWLSHPVTAKARRAVDFDARYSQGLEGALGDLLAQMLTELNHLDEMGVTPAGKLGPRVSQRNQHWRWQNMFKYLDLGLDDGLLHDAGFSPEFIAKARAKYPELRSRVFALHRQDIPQDQWADALGERQCDINRMLTRAGRPELCSQGKTVGRRGNPPLKAAA